MLVKFVKMAIIFLMEFAHHAHNLDLLHVPYVHKTDNHAQNVLADTFFNLTEKHA